MNRNLLLTLGAGVGWFFGVMVSVGILFSNGLMASRFFEEAMGNALVLSFPGTLLFLIALIIAIRNPKGIDI